MRRLCLIALALAALAAPGQASAHGGGGALGYVSQVTKVTPDTPGVTVEVLEGDDRLRLVSDGAHTIVIEGYEGEPYLRFTADGVERNANSPATYLNDDRYGQVDVPATATKDATPRWEQVADEPTYEWHDHRIHWMNQTAPPAVREEPDTEHHINDWTVAGTIDGAPLAIAGTLDYAPTGGGSSNLALILLPAAALVVLLGLFAFSIIARRRHTGPSAPQT